MKEKNKYKRQKWLVIVESQQKGKEGIMLVVVGKANSILTCNV